MALASKPKANAFSLKPNEVPKSIKRNGRNMGSSARSSKLIKLNIITIETGTDLVQQPSTLKTIKSRRTDLICTEGPVAKVSSSHVRRSLEAFGL
jgi:hypothetical protein